MANRSCTKGWHNRGARISPARSGILLEQTDDGKQAIWVGKVGILANRLAEAKNAILLFLKEVTAQAPIGVKTTVA